MRSSHLHRVPPDIPPQSEQIEDLLRFARSLDSHSDPERLLCSLPAELCSVVTSNTTALIHMNGSGVTWYVANGEGAAIDAELDATQWQDEICRLVSQHTQPVIFSPLDQEAGSSALLRFFRRHGNQSLCFIPLNKALGRLGALCFARKQLDGFSKKEISLLSLI